MPETTTAPVMADMIEDRFTRLLAYLRRDRGHKFYSQISHALNYPSQPLLRKVLDRALAEGFVCKRNNKWAGAPKLYRK